MFYFGGISDLSGSWAMQRQQFKVKGDIQITSNELASGFKHISKVANAGDVGRVIGIDRVLENNTRYEQAMNAGQVRLEATQETLSFVRKSASDVSIGLLSNMNAGVSPSTHVQAASAATTLESIFGRLNGHVAGHALFAGAAVDRSAVDNMDAMLLAVEAIMLGAADVPTGLAAVEAYFNDPAGGFETSVYVGATIDAPTISIADGNAIPGGVRADTQAVRDVIRQMSIITIVERNQTVFTPSDQALYYKAAAEQNIETSDDFILLQEKIGLDQERLSQGIVWNESERYRLSVARTELTQADPFETAARFEEEQTQLDKIFAVTARLGNLSLLNYLR